MQIFTNANYNFIRWRWHALALSTVVVMAGAALVLTRGLPLGIDFSGGTAIVVRFEKSVTEQAVLDALASLPGEKTVTTAGPNEMLIRLPELVDFVPWVLSWGNEAKVLAPPELVEMIRGKS